jgi:NADPH:quinone reductase
MQLPSVMKAIRVHTQGGPDELILETIARPHPGPGQVLIKVESASINFSDIKRRRGDPYPFPSPVPFTPGGEVAGVVVELGAGVETPAIGTSVFALAGGDGQGGYAQYALAYAEQATPMPPGMEFDRASALIIAGATAMLILRQTVTLQSGQSILIPAATGAVGGYAVQLARHFNAGLIIAAVSNPAKAKEAIALGAHHAVDYTRTGWADEVLALTNNHGVDILLEASGGQILTQGLLALAPFGKAVIYGAASGQSAMLDQVAMERLFYVPAPNQSLIAFNLGSWFMGRPEQAGAALGDLIGLVMSQKVSTPSIKTMPLSQAAQAHKLLEDRQSSGKLVLKPWL